MIGATIQNIFEKFARGEALTEHEILQLESCFDTSPLSEQLKHAIGFYGDVTSKMGCAHVLEKLRAAPALIGRVERIVAGREAFPADAGLFLQRVRGLRGPIPQTIQAALRVTDSWHIAAERLELRAEKRASLDGSR